MPAAGVPDSVAVPLPLLANDTPVGSAPVCDSVGRGEPVAVIVKVLLRPSANVVVAALVMAGTTLMVNTNDCCTGVERPLLAVNVIGNVPTVPDGAVPASVAVPLPLSVKVIPAGSAPVDVMPVTGGAPVVRTVKLAAAPEPKVAAAALVNRMPLAAGSAIIAPTLWKSVLNG